MSRLALFAGAVFAVCLTTPAYATDRFSLDIAPVTFSGRYDESQYRDQFQGSSIYIEGRPASYFGFASAYEHTRIKYKGGIPDYRQNAIYLSGHASYSPAHASGSYTFRLDLHSAKDVDKPDAEDNVHVIAPQISYAHRGHSLYVDLGYADSRYANSSVAAGTLQITQWTPTLGFALNADAAHWLKLRGYFIHSSNPLRSQHHTNTSAVAISYLYYPLSSFKLMPRYIETTILAGERIYAVDRDTVSVTNLDELEKGEIALGAQWRISKYASLRITGTYRKFSEQSYSGYNDYFQKSLSLGLVMHL